LTHQKCYPRVESIFVSRLKLNQAHLDQLSKRYDKASKHGFIGRADGSTAKKTSAPCWHWQRYSTRLVRADCVRHWMRNCPRYAGRLTSRSAKPATDDCG
jgi:hypothetical protein